MAESRLKLNAAKTQSFIIIATQRLRERLTNFCLYLYLINMLRLQFQHEMLE